MTSLQVRTAPSQADRGARHLLDWFPDRARSTVQYHPQFAEGLVPSSVAEDLFRIAGAVFCADKLCFRANARDHWTRDIDLSVPVSDPVIWRSSAHLLTSTLNFLSGDRWTFSFDQHEARPRQERIEPPPAYEVSLFSGGLDSLAGAIDALSSGKRLVLVGHHDAPAADTKQRLLHEALVTAYGKDAALLRSLWLRPGAPTNLQARPLPAGEIENTTRARSFLFLAAAVLVADGLGPGVPVYIPENGFIGINVPLTPARAGSLSTRTTHPLYMHRMSVLLNKLGLDHPIRNPYRLMTKGEALAASRNAGLLRALAPSSVSCSHPEAARWRERPQGNCGYCYPCLIRRASLHRIGLDREADYSWHAHTDPDLLDPTQSSGASLRSLASSLARPAARSDVLRNGPIPDNEAGAFADLYGRGRDELRTWMRVGASPELLRRLGE